jgi:hypothetical protein
MTGCVKRFNCPDQKRLPRRCFAVERNCFVIDRWLAGARLETAAFLRVRPGQKCIDLRCQFDNMAGMDSDEKEICNYLKSLHGQYVSSREIARRAGGKWRFRDDPNWATQSLLRLVEKSILESDASGYYRLRATEKKKPKKWISPHIKAILEKSGKDFGGALEVDKQDDSFE